MSNPNLEPLPFRRAFGGPGTSGSSSSRTLAELAAAVSAPTDEDAFVDVSGLAKVRQIVTGACRKCGYPGHLPFQCRNYIQLKPGLSTVIDVSSTSSESDAETPLVKKHKKKHKKKESKKKHKKTKKHRKRSSSSSDSDSDDDRSKKSKKRKRRNSSSSSEDERKSKKKKKKKN